MEKVTSLGFVVGLAKRRVLCAGAIAAAVALVGTKVLADDAGDIESFYAGNAYVQWNNLSGSYPVITAFVSNPGTVSWHLFTGWSILAQDPSGSMEIFSSASALTNLNSGAGAGTPYTASASPDLGDAINVAGQWSPFHQIPELGFSTVASSNNYINRISSGNALPTPPIFTVSQLNIPTLTTNIAGYFLEIQNATISGSTGSFHSTFPTYAEANIASESYTITDGSGSMTMFDWVTSDSVNAALGGTPVIAGAVNVY